MMTKRKTDLRERAAPANPNAPPKAPYSLLPFDALEAAALAMDAGNRYRGYTPGSWRTLEPDALFDAIVRHYRAARAGRVIDSESGTGYVTHAAAIAANGLMLCDLLLRQARAQGLVGEQGPVLDDAPEPSVATEDVIIRKDNRPHLISTGMALRGNTKEYVGLFKVTQIRGSGTVEIMRIENDNVGYRLNIHAREVADQFVIAEDFLTMPGMHAIRVSSGEMTVIL